MLNEIPKKINLINSCLIFSYKLNVRFYVNLLELDRKCAYFKKLNFKMSNLKVLNSLKNSEKIDYRITDIYQ